jgi:hypothetical protein
VRALLHEGRKGGAGVKRTKDQRDLDEVLTYVTEARNVAYDLFRRRLDTQRNVNSFILLRDAFVLLREACDRLEDAVKQATELKSSDQLSVADEIGVRSGRPKVVSETEGKTRHSDILADVLLFPTAKKEEGQKGDD